MNLHNIMRVCTDGDFCKHNRNTTKLNADKFGLSVVSGVKRFMFLK